MSTRRKFLQTSFLGSIGLFSGKKIMAQSDTVYPTIKNEPIVLSTWDFGKEANTEAWTILGKGGRALDAVEAGVKIPEADPNNQSVGYGGLPDRDGHVSLDAFLICEKIKKLSLYSIGT